MLHFSTKDHLLSYDNGDGMDNGQFCTGNLSRFTDQARCEQADTGCFSTLED